MTVSTVVPGGTLPPLPTYNLSAQSINHQSTIIYYLIIPIGAEESSVMTFLNNKERDPRFIAFF